AGRGGGRLTARVPNEIGNDDQRSDGQNPWPCNATRAARPRRRGDRMKRREFITQFAVLVLQAAAHSLCAQAQRMARIGYLTGGMRTPEGEALPDSLGGPNPPLPSFDLQGCPWPHPTILGWPCGLYNDPLGPSR